VTQNDRSARVVLRDVGVEYRLYTDRERTIKGRILGGWPFFHLRTERFWALHDINLRVSEGEVLGVIGPNGSGKSTLLRVMARILDPTEGSAELRGEVRPLLDLSTTLNPEWTGRQNAYLYGAANLIPKAKMRDMIPTIVKFAELGSFFDVPLKAYSSGMIARLGFSLATHLQPDILLVDEVLAVGDEHFQHKSYFRMLELIERGSLVVLVSHNTLFLESICTRAIILDGGRLVADGEPKSVIADYRSRFS
jgi:ABC-type polysaccharide/polyol phosphate transport system ATPase subunit